VRILILTFYYQPDLSAGSFRATALVSALRQQAPAGTEIDIVTTLPNRYHSFSQDALEVEAIAGLTVRRIKLSSHQSDIRGQSRAFIHFAKNALQHVSDREYDLVLATSSRLMTAALGAYIARRKRAKLYLDIRDIFVDTIKDVLPAMVSWPAKQVFSLVEWLTMRRADRINLVSRGFEKYFRDRYAGRCLSWFTNGIDDEFLIGAPTVQEKRADDRMTILYAGNIGEGQGLHDVLPGLAVALRDRARFIVIGDGGRRLALEFALRRAGVENVELRKPMPRPQLLDAYLAADVLFLHLGAHEAFEKVLPSKLFEYAALGKPVLAGVPGFAAQFVRDEITNAAVFPPCDVQRGVEALSTLELVDKVRPEFIAKYARANIARAMADDVLAVAKIGS
jgi:glycosyltransferase involved in cell wall biosynthesis